MHGIVPDQTTEHKNWVAYINLPMSGDRIHEGFSLSPMTQEQRLTCESILSNEGSRVVVAPSHHINRFQVVPLFLDFFFYCFGWEALGQNPIFVKSSSEDFLQVKISRKKKKWCIVFPDPRDPNY